MSAGNGWSLRELPRERLEDIALRAMVELRGLRQDGRPNSYFIAVSGGFAFGALVAAAGFLIGAAMR